MCRLGNQQQQQQEQVLRLTTMEYLLRVACTHSLLQVGATLACAHTHVAQNFIAGDLIAASMECIPGFRTRPANNALRLIECCLPCRLVA